MRISDPDLGHSRIRWSRIWRYQPCQSLVIAGGTTWKKAGAGPIGCLCPAVGYFGLLRDTRKPQPMASMERLKRELCGWASIYWVLFIQHTKHGSFQKRRNSLCRIWCEPGLGSASHKPQRTIKNKSQGTRGSTTKSWVLLACPKRIYKSWKCCVCACYMY